MSRSFTCGKCGWTGYPAFELVNSDADGRSGGLFAQCNKCQWVDRAITPAIFHAVEAPAAAPAVAARPSPPIAATPRVTAPATYSEPPDVLTLVRDRLSYLTAEEARLEGIRADATARLAGMRVEGKKLRKMLAAAGRVDDVAVAAHHHQEHQEH